MHSHRLELDRNEPNTEIAVHGVVVTFDPACDSAGRSKLIASLKEHSAIDVGEIHENRLPAVIDSDSGRESRAVHEWIESRPGVLKVDVVFSAFDRESDSSEPDPTETRGSHE